LSQYHYDVPSYFITPLPCGFIMASGTPVIYFPSTKVKRSHISKKEEKVSYSHPLKINHFERKNAYRCT